MVSRYFAKQHYTIKTFSCSDRKLQLEEFGSHSSGAQFYTHSMLCTQYNMIMQWVIVHTLKTGNTPWALSLFKAFLFYVSWSSAKALMAITGPLLLPRCLGSLVGTCQNFSICGNWNILVHSLFRDLCLAKKKDILRQLANSWILKYPNVSAVLFIEENRLWWDRYCT